MPDKHTSTATGEQFRLPDLGEGLTEAEIISWHIQPGDHVVADQPLVAVETDKAIVEIPSPHAGRIGQLHAEVGALIKVGDVLVTFAGNGSEEVKAAGTVVGELVEAPAQRISQPGANIAASPRARQRARELGVDLEKVQATGPDGIIALSDVEQGAAAQAVQGSDTQSLTGVRRAMAERMANAHARVARASVTADANISTWLPECHLMGRLIRAIGAACTAHPLLNARFDDNTLSLTKQSAVNLGIAMDTEDGLFVPMMENITTLSQSDIVSNLQVLKQAVQERHIQPQQLRGQTITLSNYGAVGGQYAEMIVVPPQVAIVGSGRSFQRVVMHDGVPQEAEFLPLSLTFDHRAVTGVEACRFLLTLIQDLELTQ
jgi:2-oxoisovalerate dehydrogenase E2 component (dihydrolipoyl transacylase)